MPKVGPGEKPKERAWLLIKCLLLQANAEACGEKSAFEGIEIKRHNWNTTGEEPPTLEIKNAPTQNLSKLIKEWESTWHKELKIDDEIVRVTLTNSLRGDPLLILEDKREQDRGTKAKFRHFTLKLWHTEIEENHKCFEQEWEKFKIGYRTSSNLEGDNENEGEYDYSAQVQDWIAFKTDRFVGRTYVFEEINKFFNHPNGYFLVLGEPGAGKTSILARYVSQENKDCISHFNPKVSSYTIEEFLTNIRNEVTKRYHFEFKDIPSSSREYERYIYALFRQISVRSGGRAVFVIDALDEVAFNSETIEANTLCLPSSLPSGIYCIVTARNQDEGSTYYFKRTESPCITLDLSEKKWRDESIKDARLYIKDERIEKSEILRQRLEQLNIAEDRFVEALAEISNGNFMYLFCILKDIEDGEYENFSFSELLKQLPKDLQSYYGRHWEKMQKLSKIPPETKLDAAFYLAEADDRVTLNWLAKRFSYTKTKDLQNLRQILKEWGQFLHRFDTDQGRKYMIYHASFRDFLYQHPDLEPARLAIQEKTKRSHSDRDLKEIIANRIVDSLSKGFFSEDDEDE